MKKIMIECTLDKLVQDDLARLLTQAGVRLNKEIPPVPMNDGGIIITAEATDETIEVVEYLEFVTRVYSDLEFVTRVYSDMQVEPFMPFGVPDELEIKTTDVEIV